MVDIPKSTTHIERAELQRVANLLPKEGTLDGVKWECDFTDLVRRILFELDTKETVANSEAPMEWLEEAIEILKPVVQGADITNEYQDVEKEAMRNLMEHIRDLYSHMEEGLLIMATVCECNDQNCPTWQYGYDQCIVEKEGS